MKELENKICLVTGGAKGIGKSICEKFLSEGALVIATDIDEKNLLQWTSGIDQNILLPVIGDITEYIFCKELIKQVRSKFGRLDVLVNNAGLISYELIPFIDFNFTRKMLDVNVISTLQMIQLASRLMQRIKSGSIINIASMVGVKGVAGQVSYSASKGAVIAMTKSASKELVSYGIRVNAVAPGMVETERFKAVLKDKFETKIEDLPLGKLANSDDVANACVFLASDKSNYITGQILGVDGSLII